MRLIDEHWIAYPEFIAGELSALERLKLRLLRRPTVRYLDVICSRPTPEQRAALMSGAGCTPGGYVLVVPGGGTGHPGRVRCRGAISCGRRAGWRRPAFRPYSSARRRTPPPAATLRLMGALAAMQTSQDS